MTIRYRGGLKYQLTEEGVFFLGFSPPRDIITEYVRFYRSGKLVLAKSYAWNGPSGPTIDDETNIQGSACHDAGYQLIQLGLLDESTYRPLFDRAMSDICAIDGMGFFRAALYWAGVRLCGENYARRRETIHTVGKPIDLRGK